MCHWVSISRRVEGLWYLHIQGQAVQEVFKCLTLETDAQGSFTTHPVMLLHIPASLQHAAMSKVKGKVRPRTDHEGPEGSRRIVLLFL
jgi:hypothetical protein